MQEQKQYGDQVIYVRNGVTINALVLISTMQQVSRPGVPNDFQKEQGLFVPATVTMEEHLSLTYLDPLFAKGSLSSTDMDRATARAIGIGPLAEGGTNGWKEAGAERIEGSPRDSDEAVQYGSASEEIARLRKSYVDQSQEISKLQAELAGRPPAAPPPVPTGEAVHIAVPEGMHVNPEGALVVDGAQVTEVIDAGTGKPVDIAAVTASAPDTQLP